MAIKYGLCPGYIASKTDGDQRFIRAPQLAKLYGVKLSECVNLDIREEIETEMMKKELILLHPDYFGNYVLPITTPIPHPSPAE